jgi:hypothetical protein
VPRTISTCLVVTEGDAVITRVCAVEEVVNVQSLEKSAEIFDVAAIFAGERWLAFFAISSLCHIQRAAAGQHVGRGASAGTVIASRPPPRSCPLRPTSSSAGSSLHTLPDGL